jgi:hypothetical protein
MPRAKQSFPQAILGMRTLSLLALTYGFVSNSTNILLQFKYYGTSIAAV